MGKRIQFTYMGSTYTGTVIGYADDVTLVYLVDVDGAPSEWPSPLEVMPHECTELDSEREGGGGVILP